MPQEAFQNPQNFYGRLNRTASVMRRLVAEAMSTGTVHVKSKDVNFIPSPYPPGSKTELPVLIEIETIGLPERKSKLTKQVVRTLKIHLLEAINAEDLNTQRFFGLINPGDPLVWIKFIDPDGYYL